MPNLERVRKLAKLVAAQYQLTVPVDLARVITAVCTIEKKHDIDVDGYTVLDCVPPQMFIRADMPPQRTRFTIAHELGHILIPWHNGKSTYAEPRRQGSSYLDKNEDEADAFAAELLLPEDWMKQYLQISTAKSVVQVISEIMETANVSFIACVRSMARHWSPENLLFYALPDWEYWRICAPCGFHFAMYRPTEQRDFSLYKKCAIGYKAAGFGAYQLMHFQFLAMPNKETIKQLYIDLGCNLETLLNRITQDKPILAVPFLDSIVSSLPGRVLAFVFLKGYKPNIIWSQETNSFYFPQTDDYYSEKEAVIERFPDYNFNEIQLGTLGKMMWVKAPYNQPPNRKCNNPNALLKEMLEESYYDQAEALKANRKINGILGGSNNRKDKGSPEKFYDDIYDRIRLEQMLRALLEHPDFPVYLWSKICLMLSVQED